MAKDNHSTDIFLLTSKTQSSASPMDPVLKVKATCMVLGGLYNHTHTHDSASSHSHSGFSIQVLKKRQTQVGLYDHVPH